MKYQFNNKEQNNLYSKNKDVLNNNEFHDFFEIYSGDLTSVVPLHAFANSAIILFDNIIDLGFVSLGNLPLLN